MKLTEGKIWKRMIVFYIPLLMSSLLQQLYNAVDAVVVGKYFGADKEKEVADTIKDCLPVSIQSCMEFQMA